VKKIDECLRGLDIIKNPLDKIVAQFGKNAKLYEMYIQDIETLDFAMRFIRRVNILTIEQAIEAEYKRQAEFGMQPSFKDLAIAITNRIEKGSVIYPQHNLKTDKERE
jgi:hypothetical protein